MRGILALGIIVMLTTPARGLEIEVHGQRSNVVDRNRPEADTTVRRTVDQPAGGTLADTLSEAAGTEPLRSGGNGTFSTISVRGASAGQIDVDLEGIPLAGAGDSIVNFSDFDSLLFDRIALTRNGIGSGLAGHVSLGLLQVRKRLRMVTMCGSYGTCQNALAARLLTGPTAIEVAGAGFVTRGNYRFPHDNGTPLNPADDSQSVARNNQARRLNLLGKARYRYARGQVAFLLFGVYHNYGLTGRDFAQTRKASMTSQRLLASVNWRHLQGNWTFALRGYGAAARLHFNDRFGELGLGNPDRQTDIWEEGVRGEALWRFSARAQLTLVSRIRLERSQTRELQTGQISPVAERVSHREKLKLATHPLPGWLSLSATILPTGSQTTGQGLARLGDASTGAAITQRDLRVDPAVGLLVAERLPVSLSFSWSRSYRRPTFTELFGNVGPLFPNPELLPERARNWDTGLILHNLHLPLQASLHYFQRLIFDQITWIQNSPNTSKAVNLERVFSQGVEAQWQTPLALMGGWEIQHSGAASWLQSIDRGRESAYAGRIRPQTATFTFWQRTELLWHHGSWKPSLFWQSRWRSAFWRDRANREQIPAAETQDLGIRLKFADQQSWETELTVRNFLNRVNYDYDRYPLPRRGIYLQIGISL